MWHSMVAGLAGMLSSGGVVAAAPLAAPRLNDGGAGIVGAVLGADRASSAVAATEVAAAHAGGAAVTLQRD